MENEKKIKEFNKMKLERNLIMFLSFATIVLEIIALFGIIHYLWGMIPFSLSIAIKGIGSREPKKKDKSKDKKESKKKIIEK